MTDEKKEGFRVTDRRGEAKEAAPAEASPEEKPKQDEPKAKAVPQIDFTTFVLSLSTSAFVHMGLVEDPHTKKTAKNLELAKQEIDIIEMLDEKTKGNLVDGEKKLMSEVLYQLRLKFVEQSNS